MKYLVTLYDQNQIDALLTYADGLIVGNDLFATRLTKSHSLEAINEMILYCHQKNKSIFIQANQMFSDDALSVFEENIAKLNLEHVTGVVVADIGSFRILSKLGYSEKVIYNPETLLTNAFDFNFLASFNTYGAYVAKEITLEDILYIAKHKKVKLFMVGHGYLNMFYSRRQLVNNYANYIKQENVFHERQDLKIVEEKRKDEAYPILEDKAGTHVFRSKVFASYSVLEKLEHHVDYFVLDTIFKSDQYGVDILKLYQDKNVNETKINQLMQTYNEVWDQGFLFNKTIYKAGK